MRVTLKVWRQQGPQASGEFVTYVADGLSPEMSFLEMLDSVKRSPHRRRRFARSSSKPTVARESVAHAAS